MSEAAELIVSAIGAHVAEAVAGGIGVLIQLGAGALEGAVGTVQDLIYFSLSCYTTIGFGGVVGTGPLRILSGIEGITGLVLIAWTASFAYVEMQRYWVEWTTGGDMVIGIFRNRLRAGAEGAYGPVAERMVELVGAMPGFVGIKTFVADDGERVSIFEFESMEALEAWRADAEHQVAQRRGREEFYSDYELVVCDSPRRRRFRAP